MRSMKLWSLQLILGIGLAITLIPNIQGVEPDTKPAFKVVQLGDSYSSGNGARDQYGSVAFNSVKECYRRYDIFRENLYE